jgi:hypothetical protein
MTQWHQALRFAEEELVLESLLRAAGGGPSGSDAKALVQAEIDARVKAKSSTLKLVSLNLLTDLEVKALIGRSVARVRTELTKRAARPEILAKIDAFWQGVDRSFSLNAGAYKQINAKDKSGRPVSALHVLQIPSFHVALVTKVAAGRATVFQIDGANPTVPSRFLDAGEAMIRGAFLTILRPTSGPSAGTRGVSQK